MSYQKKFEHIKEIWSLKQEGDFIDTTTGKLVFVSYNNSPAILKMFSKESDEYLSGRVLKHYAGDHAVKVLCVKNDTLLLERCMPGKHLKELSLEDSDNNATNIFCDILTNLHKKQFIPNIFPDIAVWGKGFNRYLDGNNDIIPHQIVQNAKNLFFELVKSQSKKVLLHGDLHHDNILFDKKRGWLAIDPKGIIGEAEIEASAFFKNPIGYPETYSNDKIIENRINTIANALGLDKARMIKWCYALTILSCIWLTESNKNHKDWLNLSEILKRMI